VSATNLRFRLGAHMGRDLVERGLTLTAVLRHARLPLAFFEQEKVWATTEELFALWTAIGELSGDPGIGLSLGTEDRLERYAPVSVAMLYTRSFGEALARAARYKRLTCPEDIVLVANEDELHARFQWESSAGGVPDALLDFCFSWIVTIARRGTGVSITPARIELRRPERHRTLLEAHYGCPVVFGAADDALVFRASDVERPFLTHNADLLAILAPHLEAELQEQRAVADVSGQVKSVLKRLLAGGRPDLDDVARELCVTARTLQRRIAEQGRTYQQLLEQARRELSQHYLAEGKLELNEVAFLLGYGDASSFFRAFRQWEGVSPGQWRAQRNAVT
jgi:AraC-like DNA-binding protein